MDTEELQNKIDSLEEQLKTIKTTVEELNSKSFFSTKLDRNLDEDSKRIIREASGISDFDIITASQTIASNDNDTTIPTSAAVIDYVTNSLSGLSVSNFGAAAIVTESEGLASSDNDTSIPTTAAVLDWLYFTINTNPNDDWYTIQLRAPHNLTGSEWTTTAVSSWVELATGEQSLVSGSGASDTSAFTTDFYSIFTGSQLTFASGHYFRAKVRFKTFPGEGTNITNDKFGFWGFAPGSNSVAYGHITGETAARVGFCFYDQKIYALVADGTNITSVNLMNYTGSTMGGIKQYEIVVNGTASVEFWIDGTLQTTITDSNIPDSGTAKMQFSSTIGPTYNDSGFDYISHIIYSERMS